MNTLTNILQKAEKAVLEKDWKQAVIDYEQAIELAPDNEEIICNLGLCYIKARDFTKARELLESAVHQSPAKAIFQRQLGNIYKRAGQLSLAKQTYEKAIELEGDEASAYNNLGLVYFKEHNYSKAQTLFETALNLKKDYAVAMYNLALTYRAQDRPEEAVACLVSLTESFPRYAQSYFLLGKILLDKGLKEDASKFFSKLASLQPDNTDVLRNIAYCLLEHNHFSLAKPYCQTLASLNEKDFEMQYNLGIVFEKEGDPDQAIACYQAALANHENYFDALNNLAVLYLGKQDIAQAKVYFQRALDCNPNDQSIQHTLSAISGQQASDKAPQAYIAKLFDQYADHFDQHLQTSLDYKVPELLFSAVETVMANQFKKLNMLDLGCGTGLAGSVFKSRAKRLVGVDLSPKMIDVAKTKVIYDALVIDDILNYLTQTEERFGLILSADVFVYLGNLTPLFSAIKEHLSTNGAFAFSIELAEGEAFSLQKTGRFSHSVKYIQDLAQQFGFNIAYAEQLVTRKQLHKPVYGGIFVLISSVIPAKAGTQDV